MHQIIGSDCFLEGPYNGTGWWEYLFLGHAHFLTFFIIFQIQRENVSSLGKSFQSHFKNISEKLKAKAQYIFVKNETHSFYIHGQPTLVLSNEDINISKKWFLSSTIHCNIFSCITYKPKWTLISFSSNNHVIIKETNEKGRTNKDVKCFMFYKMIK